MTAVPLSRRELLAFTAGASLLGCASQSLRVGGGQSRRVVVLGAGLSGLAAALELKRRGFEVQVLEAQAQPGGRIRTLRAPLPDGLHVEAGATHVVGEPELMELLKRFNVPLEQPARRRRWPKRVLYRDGVRTVVDAQAPLPEEGPPLRADEEALGFPEQLAKYFGTPAEHDPRSAQWPPPALAPLDRLNGAELLRQRGASDGYLALAESALCPNGDLKAISGLALIREALNLQLELGWDDWRVVGGADGIPRALASGLAGAITYGAKVTRIEQTDAGAQVTYVHGGQTRQLSARHIVCAIPGPVVPGLELTPPLPLEQRRAFEGLKMTSTTRVFVGSRSRFWNERGESGAVEAPFGAVRDETSSPDSATGVLALHASGAEGQRLGKLSPADREQEAINMLERVHPGLRAQASGTASVSWSEDPLFRGAFAWLAPGQLTTEQPLLRSPHGTVHFAGDYNSHRPGFMHGALQSARRVVEEIVAAAGSGV